MPGPGGASGYEELAERKRQENRRRQQKQQEVQRELYGDAAVQPSLGVGHSRLPEANHAELRELEAIAEDMGVLPASQARGKPKKKKKKQKKSVAEVHKKLGEANLLYINEQYQEAKELLTEVVRLAPEIPDSYHTLGLIHEHTGDQKRALDFYMIAAHLTPGDVDLWRRVALLSGQLQQYPLAIDCLSRVVRLDPDDLGAKWDRAVWYHQVGEYKKAVEGFEELLKSQPGDPEITKALARALHGSGHSERALFLLESFVARFPQAVDLTTVNMQAELYMLSSRWADTVALIEAHSAASTAAGPEQLPPDLAAKYGICLLYLGRKDDAFRVLGQGLLLEADVSGLEDLFAEVAQALASSSEYRKAIEIYNRLREGVPEYDQEALWMKLADCYERVGDVDRSADLYSQVLQASPENVEARVALAKIWGNWGEYGKKTSRTADGIALLDWFATSSIPLGPEETKRAAEAYLHVDCEERALQLLLPLARRSLKSCVAAQSTEPGVRKRGALQAAVARRVGTEAGDEGMVFTGLGKRRGKRKANDAAASDEGMEAHVRHDEATKTETGEQPDECLPPGSATIEMVLQVCTLMLSLGDGKSVEEVQGMLKDALLCCSNRALERQFRSEIQMLQAVASACSQHYMASSEAQKDGNDDNATEKRAQEPVHADGTTALQLSDSIRQVCALQPECTTLWNMFSQYIADRGAFKAKDQRFLLRQRKRHPHNVAIMLLLGHHHMASQSYSLALAEYMSAFALEPTNTLVLLCCAVASLHLVRDPFTRRKARLRQCHLRPA